jgi:ATP-dependent RNA helicase RhlE
MTFEQFKFHPDIMAGIIEQGYTNPTPIQEKTIPPILEGRDVLGLAQTGTGKTAAFVLPILQRLVHGQRRRIKVLILAPTRELASQINDATRALGRHMRLRSIVVFGGVSISPQIQALNRENEIVVACPGRLLDLISQNKIDLSGVETLVIDEADRMFDMGFLPDIRRILKHLPQKRQTLLFSATMPDDIRHLAKVILTDAVTVQIDITKPVSTITHAVYPVEQHLKTALLKELLKITSTGSVLVFTRTKHRAKRVAEQLGHSGFSVTSLQGNLSQNKREEAIEGFRDGTYQILVATDIAARGIDVSAISHVINYDIPDTVDAYTHRIGRTGRVSRSGDAFTFITHEDAAMVHDIELTLGEKLARKKLDGFDYNRPSAKGNEFARPPRQQHPRPFPHASAKPTRYSSAKPSGMKQQGSKPRSSRQGISA